MFTYIFVLDRWPEQCLSVKRPHLQWPPLVLKFPAVKLDGPVRPDKHLVLLFEVFSVAAGELTVKVENQRVDDGLVGS